MSYSERIKILADIEGSQAKFSKKVGISPQSINKIISRGSGVNGETILAIAEAYPNLNIEWFVTGKGEMWKSDMSANRETPMTDDEKETLKDQIIALQKSEIQNLKRAILEKAPELAEYLNIDISKI